MPSRSCLWLLVSLCDYFLQLVPSFLLDAIGLVLNVVWQPFAYLMDGGCIEALHA